MESLTVYSDRIKNCLQFVEDTCLKVCNKCLIQRERRVGIDFCIDDVERELKKERRVIMGVIQMLTRTLEQAYEQVGLHNILPVIDLLQDFFTDLREISPYLSYNGL